MMLTRMVGWALCILAFKVSPASEAALIARLVNRSALPSLLAQVAPLLKSSMTQGQDETHKLPDQYLSRFARAVDAAFDAGALQLRVRENLEAALSVEEAQQVLSWLETDLGRKVVLLEEKSFPLGTLLDSARMAEEVRQDSSARRSARLERLRDAIHSNEALVSLTVNMSVAMAVGYAHGTKVPEESVARFRRTMQARRPQIAARIAKAGAEGFAITYRELTDRELDQYIAFAESPSARRYHAATVRSLDAAIEESCRELGNFMGSAVN